VVLPDRKTLNKLSLQRIKYAVNKVGLSFLNLALNPSPAERDLFYSPSQQEKGPGDEAAAAAVRKLQEI
jgi:hypothetical protein